MVIIEICKDLEDGLGSVRAVVMLWRLRRKIISIVLCCVVCHSCELL